MMFRFTGRTKPSSAFDRLMSQARRDGDRVAYEACLRRLADLARDAAGSQSPVEAREALVTRCLVKGHQKRATYGGPASFDTWAAAIVARELSLTSARIRLDGLTDRLESWRRGHGSGFSGSPRQSGSA